ncbi:MAG TPA: hypothetical protein VGC96_11525 [Candidatus Elarobacter sp.]|jgi:hypothetical protein
MREDAIPLRAENTGEWHRLRSLITTLEQRIEDLEGSSLRAVVARRADHANFEPGTPGRTEAILGEVDGGAAGDGAAS